MKYMCVIQALVHAMCQNVSPVYLFGGLLLFKAKILN